MKRSLRDYILTLVVAVVIFAVVAFFLVQIAEGLMGDVIHKIGSEGENPVTEEAGGESAPVVNPGSSSVSTDDAVAFLLLGIDQQKNNADAIFLVGINSTKLQATITLIPSNTQVVDGGSSSKLGELYSTRGIGFFQEFVAREIGVTVDHYAAMSMSALENLIDFLGGIQYNVPQNMYYFDPTQNLHINLKSGPQKLNGDQVVQLVTYRGYTKGDTAREDTQLSFARAFCETFLVPANLSRAKAILYNVFYNVETDFQEMDLNELGETIFHFDAYTQSYVRIPGKAGKTYYTLDSTKAKAMFQGY